MSSLDRRGQARQLLSTRLPINMVLKKSMVQKRTICMALLVLVGCNGETRTSRTDSVAVSADSSVSRLSPNNFSAFAGDTLELVSIGGRPVPQPGGAPLPCDSARTPLRERIVASADTTYWKLTVVRPGCRDTVKFRTDTVESRARYDVVGDTLHLHSRNDGPEFFGLLFPDSVVEVGKSADKVWRYSRRGGAPGNPVEMGHLTTDTVFLARDLDASGKTDYVVHQSREGPMQLKDERIAIYLDTDPGTRAPDWATPWDFSGDHVENLGDVLPVAPGVSLVEISLSGDEYDRKEIFIVEKGKLRRELTHGVEDANGYLTIKQDAGKTVVEATLENLELRDVPVTSDIKCPEPKLAAMKLVFDLKTGRFTPGRAFCVRPPTS
jgi:hypothetical protein